MKTRLSVLALALLAFLPLRAERVIRVNLAGYLPDDVKDFSIIKYFFKLST